MSCELHPWWDDPENFRPCDMWECRECGATTSEDRTGSWPLCGDCWGRLWWTLEDDEELV